MDQYIGKLLDNRYEILERIGVGGMAMVYKARCHRLNRLVAVKILRDDLAQDAEFRRRFHDESQAVAMLSHPNIVAVYDVSRSSELEYIVMELIDGLTLKQYMQRKNNKLNWREALHFIIQICKALGHAHGRGIIHRDIKPHNVMVLRDGSVKVADFGIARLASNNHSTLTQETLGSVHYISPEQARGSHIDARSDLYSAGVVLYEMVTGRLPFEGDSPVSVAIQHINSIPLSPRELDPSIPEALEAITMKAMAPVADNRYLSADAMLVDLEAFRKNPAINFEYKAADYEELEVDDSAATQIRSVAPSVRERTRKPPQKRVNTKHSSADIYEDDEPERTGGPWVMVVAVIAILLFVAGIFYFLVNTIFNQISQGAVHYTVPTLVGEMYEDGMKSFDDLGDFQVILGETMTSEEPEGTIISQSPAAGTSVDAPDSTITVVVSGGKEIVYMIDITGQEYMAARIELQAMGLDVEIPEYEFNDEIPYNHIISFTPLQETALSPGDKVQLVVSKGPKEKTVTLPSFVDMTRAMAESQIELFHLKVNVLELNSETVPEGRVFYQYPAATTEVTEGTEITIHVSIGPEEPVVEEPPPVVEPGGTKTVTLHLPATGGTVHVLVVMDGNTFYENNVDTADLTDPTVSFTVRGAGTKTLYVYYNGNLAETVAVDLN